MATSTLAVVRQKLSEEVFDWRSESTTSAGNGGGTTLVSTALSDKGDDFYNDNYWVILTSGTYSGQARRVSDFTSSTGTVTVSTAFGGQVANAVTFELHKFRPIDITRALNDAAQEAYPFLSRRIIDTNLITGNWLHDGGFEDWSSATALVDWAAQATGTFSQQTSVYSGRLYGAKSAIVTPGGANGGIAQSVTQNKRLLDLPGYGMEFRVLAVQAATPDAVAAIVDGSTTTSSSAVATATLWTRLTVTRTIPSPITSSTLSCRVISPGNVTFRVDNARLIGPDIHHYKLPAHIRTISQVELQVTGHDTYPCDDENFGLGRPLHDWRIIDDGTDRYLYIPHYLPSEYKLRLTASGPIATLSSDTDTIELGATEPPMRAYIALAAHILYRQYTSLVTGQDRAEYGERTEYYYQQWEKLKRAHCWPQPGQLPQNMRYG